MSHKVSVRNIYKIFGGDPSEAMGLLEAGRTKEEIFSQTGQTVGVRDISFDVEEAQIFVVMGLSGSGKSTLVRMINGLISPTSGQILIDDVDVASCSKEALRQVRRDKVAMVFQHFALFPHKTVGENVAYGLKVKGVGPDERREKALRSLAQVGLEAYADSYPDELSGGMQQRVGLARGLAAEPEILLMDEPFSALDPLIRRDMQEELLELQRSLKKTIIFITHDLNEALILGDQIAIMKDGRFVQVGTAEEIVDKPADDYVAAFTQDIDRSRVFDIDSVMSDPQTLDASATSVALALTRMEELDRDALFVTDATGGIAGLVTYRGLTAAARSGGTLDSVLVRDIHTIRRDVHLHDIYIPASEGMPVAVVDDAGKLVGVVEPHAVFAQLTGSDTVSEGTRRAAP
ncbi:glycine betaine/L-proline ABC transporter ATP-binding protein [Mesorhizobium sp. CAU 1732]|uniref:quaternary amine ABC transporter ATP-binding protein n=1 Tax=Mesorhizobium sp. CAU 1732 TaxID=3140358 RepID=UPI00325FFB14